MWSEMMRHHTLLLIMMVVMKTLALDTNEQFFADHDEETALREGLLDDYSKDHRPAKTTTVELAAFTLQRLNMHEEEHYIEVHGRYTWEWRDLRLSWRTSDYNKIGPTLNIPSRKLWKPDIAIYNSVDKVTFDDHGDVNAVVYSEGRVLYIPPATLRATCITDMTYWPHDVQVCKIKHGSWTHDGNAINVTIRPDQFDLSDFVQFSEWKLMTHEIERGVKYYKCCEEPYIDFTFEMHIERNAPALVYTFKIPAIGLSFLSLFVFLLPPTAGEKLLLSSLLLLVDQQFLIHTMDVVQHSPTNVPIVIRLVSEQLYLVLISLIVGVVTLRMSRPPHGEPLPSFIMAPLRAMAPFLLLGKYANLSYHPVHEIELDGSTSTAFPIDSKNKKETTGDWILIAAIVDRLLFIIYFFIVIANLIAYARLL